MLASHGQTIQRQQQTKFFRAFSKRKLWILIHVEHSKMTFPFDPKIKETHFQGPKFQNFPGLQGEGWGACPDPLKRDSAFGTTLASETDIRLSSPLYHLFKLLTTFL